MAKIGIVPMSAKPYHVGHDMLVRLAATENDEAHVFVSLSDRDDVSGKAMEKIWKDQIEPSLPSNVTVTYGGSPVGNAFKEMGDASEAGSQDTYVVYSDPDDAGRFDDATLAKYTKNLKVVRRPVERTSTVDISGTKMRSFLSSGDKKSFIKYLPKGVDGNVVWDTLQSMKPQPVTKKKAVAKKKPVKSEALLRSFIRTVLRG